jgi:hypothetical protein
MGLRALQIHEAPTSHLKTGPCSDHSSRQHGKHATCSRQACKDRVKKKKKGVTRVAHAATLQLNPAKYGHTRMGRGLSVRIEYSLPLL